MTEEIPFIKNCGLTFEGGQKKVVRKSVTDGVTLKKMYLGDLFLFHGTFQLNCQVKLEFE